MKTMMRKFMAGAIFSGLALTMAAGSASAGSLDRHSVTKVGADLPLIQVDNEWNQRRHGDGDRNRKYRRGDDNRGYDRRRGGERYARYNRRNHGHRYRDRRPGFSYYYGGYYYAQPWWMVGPGYGYAPGLYDDYGSGYGGPVIVIRP